MPTGGKLFAAILLAAVGWLAAEFTLWTYPEDMSPGWLRETMAVLGVWQGWMVIGPRAGQGVRAGIGYGVRASVQMVVIGIAIFALVEMFSRATRLRYDSPGEATIATLTISLQYLQQTMTVPIWGAILVGGAIAGLGANAAGRLFR